MSDINPPRAYDLSQPDEFKRLMRETWGYLHTCRTTKCGGDFEGRAFAMAALQSLWDQPESAQGARVPEGYVLAPKEPTEAMVDAGETEMATDDQCVNLLPIYKAMLAASPPTPSAPREPMTVTDEMVRRFEKKYGETWHVRNSKDAIRMSLEYALGQEKG